MTRESEYAVLSVMGPHAGEGTSAIFARKIADVRDVAKTFWLIQSYKAKPDMVQRICEAAASHDSRVRCFFLEASTKNGAAPTRHNTAATHYSSDNVNWIALPSGLSPVTGHITARACALVFSDLQIETHSILDCWDYADALDQEHPIRFRQGASTQCAFQKDMRHHTSKMQSNLRRVLAVGVLTHPYAVWLK
jgi:hypothetical protein